MAKKNHLTGVDIGSTAVRVARVSGYTSSGRVIVSHLASSPLRNGAVVAGEIRDSAAVASALQSALTLASAPKKGFIVGLSGVKTGVARVNQIGGLTPAERLSAAKHQNLPLPAGLDTTTSRLAVAVMRERLSAEKSQNTEVVFAASDPRSVEVLTKVCQLAKVSPRAIDLSAAATTRAYVRVPEDDQTSALLVDIGDTSMTVIARHGPSLVYIDTTAGFGGATLTKAVQTALGVDAKEAEQRKRAFQLVEVASSWNTETFQDRYGTGDAPIAQRESLEDLTNTELSAAADILIEHLSNSVNTSLNYIPGGQIQSLFLVGGTSQMRGLAERIESHVGIRTQRAMPWVEIEAHKRNLEFFIDRNPATGNENPEVLTEFATAIGLAQWRETK